MIAMAGLLLVFMITSFSEKLSSTVLKYKAALQFQL
jgi:hypothetical protein